MRKLIRNSFFFTFYILALRLIVVELFSTSFIPALETGLLIFLFSLAGRRNPIKTLYLFFALIPLLHGLRMLAILPNLPIVDLCFAGIYLAWLPKYYLTNNQIIYRSTTTEYLADWLGIVIIVSLLTILAQYPVQVSWHALTKADVLGQQGRFWGIEAARIFLQGLILFRIYLIERKVTEINHWQWFTSALFAQLFFITCFSLFQFFSGLPETRVLIREGTINSPFDDRHSFGSILVMYFFILSGYLKKSGKELTLRFISLIFIAIIAVIIIKTGSVVTLATLFLCTIISLLKWVDWKKILILTLLFIIPLIYFNLNPNLLNKITHPTLHRVAVRLLVKNVPKYLSGRFENADQALGIISTYPISGSGIGSFYRVARHYHFSDHDRSKQIENAHNYYLQLASEAGLPALILFLTLLLTILCNARKKASAQENLPGFINKQGLIMGIAAYMITMLTSHPLILPVQQFCFWMVVAHLPADTDINGTSNRISSPIHFKSALAILFFLVLIGGATYKNLTFFNSPTFGYGGYHLEKHGNQIMQWIDKYFARKIFATSDILSLTFQNPQCDMNPDKGVNLRISINDHELDNLQIFSSNWQQLNYHLPGIKGQQVVIKIEVDQTFNPYKSGINNDHRELGTLIQPITFLHIMPETDFGFFQWESITPPSFPEWQGIKTTDGRWMGRQASINISNLHDHDFRIYYLCSHPDIQSKPVTIQIISDNSVLNRSKCKDNQWHRICLNKNKLKESEILTISLDRTYNPKTSGQSDDRRNLGLFIVTRPNLHKNK